MSPSAVSASAATAAQPPPPPSLGIRADGTMAVRMRERTIHPALGQPEHCVWNDVKRAGAVAVNPLKCPSVACCRADACGNGTAAAAAASLAETSSVDGDLEAPPKHSEASAGSGGVLRAARSTDSATQGGRRCVRIDAWLTAAELLLLDPEETAAASGGTASSAAAAIDPAATLDADGGGGLAMLGPYNVSLGSDEVCFGGERAAAGGRANDTQQPSMSAQREQTETVQLVYGVPVSRYASIAGVQIVLR